MAKAALSSNPRSTKDTQEAKIRRIMVQSQPRQILQKTLLKNTQHKKGLKT
jgi:hypothetical protein